MVERELEKSRDPQLFEENEKRAKELREKLRDSKP